MFLHFQFSSSFNFFSHLFENCIHIEILYKEDFFKPSLLIKKTKSNIFHFSWIMQSETDTGFH